MKGNTRIGRKLTALALACALLCGGTAGTALAAINHRTQYDPTSGPAAVTELPSAPSQEDAAPPKAESPSRTESSSSASAQEEDTLYNVALNAVAVASDIEAADFPASKAVDGIVNRGVKPNSDQSRWASDVAGGTKWLKIDFGKSYPISSIALEWERRNPTDYSVELSEDGENWTSVYTGTQTPSDFREEIALDAPVSGRYLQIVIRAFNATSETVTWNTVSLFEVEAYSTEEPEKPDEPIEEGNLCLKGTATASSSETADFPAGKAIDGLVNRDASPSKNQSRWASAVGNGPHWLKVDLGAVKPVKNIALEWERRNATSYTVDFSEDGQTWGAVYTGTAAPANFRQVITLDEAVKTRYIRVYISKFNANSEGVNWNTVSLYEVEAYSGDIPQTLADVAASLQVPAVQAGDNALTMPEVPEDCSVELIGADYEQVIGSDGTIYPPVSDVTVSVMFLVTRGIETAKSSEIAVSIPGTEPEGGNAKPLVIPELREWSGGQGNFSISNATRIVVDDAYARELLETANTFAADYEDITGRWASVTTGSKADAHGFFLTLDTDDAGLGDEGYYLRVDDSLTIEAETAQGVFLGTRSVLQILKQTGTTIPKGVSRDYPKFKVRGFMFDVARRPVSLDFITEVMKTMSWYKMNDFHLHLNDNYLSMNNYATKQEAIENAYSAFRLESDVRGENGVYLTAQDLSYSKRDFGNFIDLSKQYGVNIVPEFDSPGHSLAFVKVHPEFSYSGPNTHSPQENAAMLDVTNPEAIEFMKGIFDEYLDPQDGEEPVFRDSVFHVGADEFYGNAEQYRAYADTMLKYVMDKGITPRIWGSLTSKSGSTPVVAKGVQMDIWNRGWCNPTQMFNLGYDMINILDGKLYIVPGATYYRDYLDVQNLYNSWTPNNFEGTVISACEPQVLGGSFALWNDLTGISYNGITEYDMFDRLFPPMQVLSEKCWGEGADKTYAEFQSLAKIIGTAPNTNPRGVVESKGDEVLSFDFEGSLGRAMSDTSDNGYDALYMSNVELTDDGKNGQGLAFTSYNSHVSLPLANMGPEYSMSMWVKRELGGNGEQVLLESTKGKFKAVQAGTGKVGFSRDGVDYSFDYTLPVGEWVKLGIVGQHNKTKLFVNDVYVDEISRANTIVTQHGVSTAQFGTFLLPLATLGSETDAFQGMIDDFTVYKGDLFIDKSLVPHSKMTATATSEKNPASGNDGPATFAIDGDETTLWHTNYPAGASDALPQSITLTFSEPFNINKFTYLPRSSGPNGIITQYDLQVVTADGETVTVDSGSWANNASLKTAAFDAVDAKSITLTAKAGGGGFASAAELNVYQVPS